MEQIEILRWTRLRDGGCICLKSRSFRLGSHKEESLQTRLIGTMPSWSIRSFLHRETMDTKIEKGNVAVSGNRQNHYVYRAGLQIGCKLLFIERNSILKVNLSSPVIWMFALSSELKSFCHRTAILTIENPGQNHTTRQRMKIRFTQLEMVFIFLCESFPRWHFTSKNWCKRHLHAEKIHEAKSSNSVWVYDMKSSPSKSLWCMKSASFKI